MKKIAIIGAGGFGREVLTLINAINVQEPTYEVIGFCDQKKFLQPINGVPYLGEPSILNEFDSDLEVTVAIGDPRPKQKIVEGLNNPRLSYPNLIHPSVIIGDTETVKMGSGNLICAGCILTTDIEIGSHVILNLSCTVGHDTTIEDFSSFMPTVNISGEVFIRKAVYVGTGAKIINQLEIGASTTVGAGAVVSKTLPPSCTAVGVPAKPIKFH